MLTRRDLDQIAERLGVPAGRSIEADLLRQRLGQAHLILDALAREPEGQPCGPLAVAARAILKAHGHPSWSDPDA